MGDPPDLRVIDGDGEGDDGRPEREHGPIRYPPVDSQLEYDLLVPVLRSLEQVIDSGEEPSIEPMMRRMARGMRWRLREWENKQRG